MNPIVNTGAVISKPDYRDEIAAFSMSQAVVPFSLPSILNTQLDSKIQMQGHIPACVSHSMVELLKHYWFGKTGLWIDFSPRFLDILSAEPDIPLDGGRRPRTVLKIMNNVGCCTTALLPNDISLSIAGYRNPAVITQAMKDEAKKYIIPGYIKSALDFYSMRQNLYFYGVLSTLFHVGKEMYDPSWKPADTDPLRTPVIVQSGHQMTVKGWSNQFLNKLRNEWSSSWGTNGETEYDPILWSPYVYEAWAIADIPKDVINFLEMLPSPSDFHYSWNTDMHYGMKTSDIKFAQIALMILGFLKPINPTDLGLYGPKTSAAVLSFQQAKGIFPTNSQNIGPKTRQKLNTLFN